MVEQLKEKSWAGLVQMLNEAEAAGRLASARQWLKRAITLRFGAVSPEMSARIDAIDDERLLESIGDRLDQAASTADLLS